VRCFIFKASYFGSGSGAGVGSGAGDGSEVGAGSDGGVSSNRIICLINLALPVETPVEARAAAEDEKTKTTAKSVMIIFCIIEPPKRI